jgi:hypothetical protein
MYQYISLARQDHLENQSIPRRTIHAANGNPEDLTTRFVKGDYQDRNSDVLPFCKGSSGVCPRDRRHFSRFFFLPTILHISLLDFVVCSSLFRSLSLFRGQVFLTSFSSSFLFSFYLFFWALRALISSLWVTKNVITGAIGAMLVWFSGNQRDSWATKRNERQKTSQSVAIAKSGWMQVHRYLTWLFFNKKFSLNHLICWFKKSGLFMKLWDSYIGIGLNGILLQ